MLVIRLSRTGKRHAPHYRIVVQEKRSRLNGRTIDIIGHYHPAQATKLLAIDHDKAQLWIGRGAQLSDTVNNLFVKDGLLPEEAKVHGFFTPVKKVEPTKSDKDAEISDKKENATAESESTVAESDAKAEAASPEIEVSPSEVAETDATNEDAVATTDPAEEEDTASGTAESAAETDAASATSEKTASKE
jgi:small subunit ribosomal protein S16